MSRKPPLFADLGADAQALLATAKSIVFSANQEIVTAGRDSDTIFVIEHGSVDFWLGDGSDRELRLEPMGPGTYFGELGVLDNSPRSASGRALEHTVVRAIRGADFRACVRANPDVATKLIGHLVVRIRELSDAAYSNAVEDVYQRIRRILIDLPRVDDSDTLIDKPPSNADLARQVGSSRERVSSIMNRLKDGRYIVEDDGGTSIARSLPGSAGRGLRNLGKAAQKK